MEFRDGTSWWCEERCSKGEESEAIYEPSIFNPATGAPAALGRASHPAQRCVARLCRSLPAAGCMREWAHILVASAL